MTGPTDEEKAGARQRLADAMSERAARTAPPLSDESGVPMPRARTCAMWSMDHCICPSLRECVRWESHDVAIKADRAATVDAAAVERACVAFWGAEHWPDGVTDPADPDKWREWMRNALIAAIDGSES